MSPALETCLGLIICHRWIPEKNVCLAVIPSEQWAIPLGLGLLSHLVAALIRDSEPHETVCWTWQSSVLCLCLLFWTHGESLSILTHLPDSQVPRDVSADRIQKWGLSLVNNTAPEFSSLLVRRTSSSALNLSSHVSNEFPIKLAVWPSSVLFSLFSFDYTQVIFLEAGD